MVTQVLIDYLKDETVDIKKKKLYLERLNLKYSDLFKLKEIFEYDRRLYQILHGMSFYRDDKFNGKLNYQNRKKKNNAKQKRIRKGKNKDDKHKRK